MLKRSRGLIFWNCIKLFHCTGKNSQCFICKILISIED